MMDSETELYGVIGSPIRHSLSPVMHNAAFEKVGMNAVYLAFEVQKEKLNECVEGIKALDIRGVNVTIPHKIQVMEFIDELDDLAARIGAVNTIVNEKGVLRGYNTDCSGAMKAIEKLTDIKDKNIAVLGAGGAARAIAFGVVDRGGNIFILNRTVEKAKQLAEDTGGNYGGLNELGRLQGDEGIDILINTTPVGMFPHTGSSPAPKKLLKNMTVMDAIYNPIKTRLLEDAQSNGCQIISGVEMFINQGADSFRLWTGKKAPIKSMRDVVLKELRKR